MKGRGCWSSRFGVQIKDSGLIQGVHDETTLNLAVKISFSVN